ncbi:hypothetical protein COLO4_03688 [Corchorus olitorius]|uniref:Uncharacterized protein n=1 Tax=Corchorus olitorius TaxID=93759 RepID=A0A1R3KXN9_9ROSI|nr:hypothetical protein COLO4_03688 [Corchorus olitorius]
MRPIQIRATVKNRFGITIDWFKARRAKLLVIKKLHMRYVKEYKLLRSYAAELGLLRAISDNMPYVERRRCARHIYSRFAKTYNKDELKMQFWKCAKITNLPEFNKEMDVFKQMNHHAHTHLVSNWDPTFWSLAYASDLSKCDVIDNNMCECFNGVILEARHKPIISMLEDIRIKIGLEQRNGKYSGMELISMRGFDVSGIPCHHAIATIGYDGSDPLHFIDHLYSKELYLRAYDKLMSPIKGPSFWPIVDGDDILPATVPVTKGRRQTERRRDELEGRKGSTKPRIGRKMKCGICRQPGHNRSKCPANVQNMGATASAASKQPSSSQPNPSGARKQGKKTRNQAGRMHYTVVNPGKESQLTIGIPVDRPPQNMTSITELREQARRQVTRARLLQMKPLLKKVGKHVDARWKKTDIFCICCLNGIPDETMNSCCHYGSM